MSILRTIGRLLTETGKLIPYALSHGLGLRTAVEAQKYENLTRQIGASLELYWDLIQYGNDPAEAHMIATEYYVNRYIRDVEYDTEDRFFSSGPGFGREYPPDRTASTG